MAIKTFKDLNVYKLSYELAMNIFRLVKNFSNEEKYSLVSQIVRSSRSICANIAEGWAKRKYEEVFKRHLIDAYGSLAETKVWLDYSLDCNHIPKETYGNLMERLEVIGGKLYQLHDNWVTFE